MGTGLLLFGSMALFLIIGVPIAFALGAAVWTTIVFSPDFLVTTGIIGQRIFGGLESTSIMAIPFFILAGNLMTKGGISKRLNMPPVAFKLAFTGSSCTDSAAKP